MEGFHQRVRGLRMNRLTCERHGLLADIVTWWPNVFYTSLVHLGVVQNDVLP